MNSHETNCLWGEYSCEAPSFHLCFKEGEADSSSEKMPLTVNSSRGKNATTPALPPSFMGSCSLHSPAGRTCGKAGVWCHFPAAPSPMHTGQDEYQGHGPFVHHPRALCPQPSARRGHFGHVPRGFPSHLHSILCCSYCAAPGPEPGWPSRALVVFSLPSPPLLKRERKQNHFPTGCRHK